MAQRENCYEKGNEITNIFFEVFTLNLYNVIIFITKIVMKEGKQLSLRMQILYKNETAKKQFCSEHKKKWRYPEQVKKKLESAENFIRSAESLMDIANYPPFHFETFKR